MQVAAGKYMEGKLREAGRAVRDALRYALDIIHVDMPVLELCERVESRIRSSGAQPAFPVNVSIGTEAAHYTAKPNDDKLIPRGSIVKVDVGAHVDGFIADAAVTVQLGTGMYDVLLRAALNALRAALEYMRPGVRARDVGAVIERAIKGHGLRPVYNLTGHRIERYNLHAGDTIPNYPDRAASTLLSAGQVYAVEPFVTNGSGYVRDGRDVTIYRLVGRKGKGELRALVDVAQKRFDGLPFSPRWLLDVFGDRTGEVVEEGRRKGVLYGYPVLEEVSGGYVAQFEDTVVIVDDGAVPLVDTVTIAT